MLRHATGDHRSAQVYLEYTMIIGVIVLVLIAMNTMIKRGTQGMIKSVADQIGIQQNAEQSFDERGHLDLSYTSTRSFMDKTRSETMGDLSYVHDDSASVVGCTIVNLGFTNEN